MSMIELIAKFIAINYVCMYSVYSVYSNVISTHLRAIDNGSCFLRQCTVARKLASPGNVQFLIRASVQLAETAPTS